jgi:hypothetical protein
MMRTRATISRSTVHFKGMTRFYGSARTSRDRAPRPVVKKIEICSMSQRESSGSIFRRFSLSLCGMSQVCPQRLLPTRMFRLYARALLSSALLD